MTMMQKIQAKKSKKGFTLVELVIVIAILAILAAIAIPVITTTINSSKLSTFKSDGATTAMLVKEAVNNNLAGVSTTEYLGTPATSSSLKVSDVLKANDINVESYGTEADNNYFERKIGGKEYAINYTTEGGVLSISVDSKATPLSGDLTIAKIAEEIDTNNASAGNGAGNGD